jgi:hypothetical protein
MSNHFSAANLKSPAGDARLDLTDLFVFGAPDNPEMTVLIMDASPFLMGKEFHPDGVYRINVDTNGDLLADVAFTFVFSERKDGAQTATAYYAAGGDARKPEPSGEVLIDSPPVGFGGAAIPVAAGACRLFFGVRSDPFFADGEGPFHGFQFTGRDTFAGQNILFTGKASRCSRQRGGSRPQRPSLTTRSSPPRDSTNSSPLIAVRLAGSHSEKTTRLRARSCRRTTRSGRWRFIWILQRDASCTTSRRARRALRRAPRTARIRRRRG